FEKSFVRASPAQVRTPRVSWNFYLEPPRRGIESPLGGVAFERHRRRLALAPRQQCSSVAQRDAARALALPIDAPDRAAAVEQMGKADCREAVAYRRIRYDFPIARRDGELPAVAPAAGPERVRAA